MEERITNGLQKQESTQRAFELKQIKKPSDLLKCEPIADRLKKHGQEIVFGYVAAALGKCALALGINLQDNQLKILTEDIVDRYIYDSIEDIIQALKKGRQGKFGFGHNRRDVLNMVLINEWMTKHLAEKAEARENAKVEESLNHKKQDEEGWDKIPDEVKRYFKENIHRKSQHAKKIAEEETRLRSFFRKQYSQAMTKYLELEGDSIENVQEFIVSYGSMSQYVQENVESHLRRFTKEILGIESAEN